MSIKSIKINYAERHFEVNYYNLGDIIKLKEIKRPKGSIDFGQPHCTVIEKKLLLNSHFTYYKKV